MMAKGAQLEDGNQEGNTKIRLVDSYLTIINNNAAGRGDEGDEMDKREETERNQINNEAQGNIDLQVPTGDAHVYDA